MNKSFARCWVVVLGSVEFGAACTNWAIQASEPDWRRP